MAAALVNPPLFSSLFSSYFASSVDVISLCMVPFRQVARSSRPPDAINMRPCFILPLLPPVSLATPRFRRRARPSLLLTPTPTSAVVRDAHRRRRREIPLPRQPFANTCGRRRRHRRCHGGRPLTWPVARSSRKSTTRTGAYWGRVHPGTQIHFN